MNRSLAILCLLIGFSLANEYLGYTFDTYLKDHKKTYSGTDYNFRKALFETRLKEIIAHNADPSFTWKLGVNQFTDMTGEEQKSYLGLNKKLVYNSHFKRGELTPQYPKPSDPKLKDSLPTSVDWRKNGIVTAVKNQGSCGSCWSFGSAETIESMWAQKTGKLVVLSEQNILDCTPNPHHCGGTGGCGGATVELAYDKVKEIGIASEKDYPYISGSGRNYACKTKVPVTANITSYVILPPNQQDPLLNAIANIGPIAISVEAIHWMSYRSGIFDGCNQKNPDIDHAVQLVGYGTDSNNVDYWIVRNSWGAGWGESGYIRLKRETVPRCGIDLTPSDGSGCDDGPPTVTVCGTCGILYDNVYPLYNP